MRSTHAFRSLTHFLGKAKHYVEPNLSELLVTNFSNPPPWEGEVYNHLIGPLICSWLHTAGVAMGVGAFLGLRSSQPM
jgi:hypothetical protein